MIRAFLSRMSEILEGAELEVQLGTSNKEVTFIIVVPTRGEYIDAPRGAGRNVGADEAVALIVILVNADPQPFNADGRR